MDIAKCPICGEKPKWVPITGWETGWKTDMLMCCGYGSTAVQGWNKLAAAMECQARHNALVEAVAWMEECLDAWLCTRMGVSLFAEMEANEFLMLARAEVDRLIAEWEG